MDTTDGDTTTLKFILYSSDVSHVSVGSRYVISQEYKSSSSIRTDLTSKSTDLPAINSIRSLFCYIIFV
jgi:hypothetical protein